MSKQLASQQPNAVAAAEATLAELMERAHLLAQARTELEADRKMVNDVDYGTLLDQLLDLKRRHIPQLEELQPMPHSMTTVAC